MAVPKVILDTNVLVAASRSKRGASAKLLSLVGTGLFEICLSVPLVLQYEDALLRGLGEETTRRQALSDILDHLCAVGQQQEVFFLWRPYLRDPGDDLVLEAAIAGGCEAIITYNQRDFGDLRRWNLEVLTPKEFLLQLGVLR